MKTTWEHTGSNILVTTQFQIHEDDAVDITDYAKKHSFKELYEQIRNKDKVIEAKSIYIKNLNDAFQDKCHKVMRERDALREEIKSLEVIL